MVTIDDEFLIKLRGTSREIFRMWNAVIDELLMGTFPSINLRQFAILRCMIHVIWDIGFSNAMYDEVVIRLFLHEKQLFPTKKSIAQSIRELCEKGIVKSTMSTFCTYGNDGKIIKSRRIRVLELPEKFKNETLNAMKDVVRSTESGYFSPYLT